MACSSVQAWHATWCGAPASLHRPSSIRKQHALPASGALWRPFYVQESGRRPGARVAAADGQEECGQEECGAGVHGVLASVRRRRQVPRGREGGEPCGAGGRWRAGGREEECGADGRGRTGGREQQGGAGVRAVLASAWASVRRRRLAGGVRGVQPGGAAPVVRAAGGAGDAPWQRDKNAPRDRRTTFEAERWASSCLGVVLVPPCFWKPCPPRVDNAPGRYARPELIRTGFLLFIRAAVYACVGVSCMAPCFASLHRHACMECVPYKIPSNRAVQRDPPAL